MLKLYGGARSKAAIVRWYLEELGVPYEFILIDLQTGAQQQPNFLAINPFGKVPTIMDNDFKLWESGAILLYLAEKYDAIAATPEHRAKLAQWVLFTMTTFKRVIYQSAGQEFQKSRLVAALNHYLEQHSFLLYDQFSAADVAMGSQFAYVLFRLNIDFRQEKAYAAFAAYFRRLSERPSFQHVFGARMSAHNLAEINMPR